MQQRNHIQFWGFHDYKGISGKVQVRIRYTYAF